MNTKQAIYFLENNVEDLGMPTPVVDERIKDVIILLQRGRKFETILQLVEEKCIQPEINNDGKIIFVLEGKTFFSLRSVFRYLKN